MEKRTILNIKFQKDYKTAKKQLLQKILNSTT